MLNNFFKIPTQVWLQRWSFFYQGKLFSKTQRWLFPYAQYLLALHLKYIQLMFIT